MMTKNLKKKVCVYIYIYTHTKLNHCCTSDTQYCINIYFLCMYDYVRIKQHLLYVFQIQEQMVEL